MKIWRSWLAGCRTAALAFLLVGISGERTGSGNIVTMKQVVAMALQNSRDLQLAKIQYNIAVNETAVERGDFRPNLYTGSGAAYTKGSRTFVHRRRAAVTYSICPTAQTLFNLPLKGRVKAAEDRANSQKLEIDRTRDDVIIRAATTYLELAKVRHSLELRHNDDSSAAKILQVTRDRVSANQELPIEITRGQLTAARIQQEIIKLENRSEILAQQIRDLTGIPDGQSVQVEAEEPDFSSSLPAADLLGLALSERPGATRGRK